METANLLRIESGGGRYGGASQGFTAHQDQRHRKMQALFEAIEAADLVLAKQIFRALLNIDPVLRSDPLFTKIGKAIDEGSLYVAQHFMRDMKTKMVNSQTFKPHCSLQHKSTSPHLSATGTGALVNIQA